MAVNNDILAKGAGGFVEIEVVLYCPPTWYSADWWAEDVRRYDHVDPTARVAAKPSVSFSVPLDTPLADALERAAQLFEIEGGPGWKQHDGRVSSVNPRMGFVRPEDEGGTDDSGAYGWPWALQVALPGGSIAERALREVTYRELLVSSSLGLVEGDVTRPYLALRQPQGMFPLDAQTLHLTYELVQAAYHALPAANEAARDALHDLQGLIPGYLEVTGVAMATGWWIGRFRAVRQWWARRRRCSPGD